MSARGEPPKEEPAPSGKGTGSQRSDVTTTNQARLYRRLRQCGRYGTGWREGFTAGAVDALRLAARRIDDPHVWRVLDELASDYDLAGSDG